MSMTGRTLAALAAFAAITFAAGADAQSARADADQPVMYGADSGEYTPEGFALRGRAEVLQGSNRLRANAINGFTANGNLQRVEASGEVYFVTPEQTIRGDRAVYALNSGEVTVTGDVILTQGKNVLTGGRLVYNVRTGTARMEGAPRGGAGNRIQGVFYPQEGN